MPHLTSRFRPEPPLTAPRKASAAVARAEPPLMARAVPQAEPENESATPPVSVFQRVPIGRASAAAPEQRLPWQAQAPAPEAQTVVPRRVPPVSSPEAEAPMAKPAMRRAAPAAPTSRRRASAAPRDPAPSRLSYRVHRLWLTPIYRAFFKVGLPAFALSFALGIYLSDETRRDMLAGKGTEVIRSIQERPEFLVNLMSIEGASPALGDAVRAALPVHFPVSSFDLDLEAMRATVAGLDAVATAKLRIRAGGILEVSIKERVPAILWRSDAGVFLLDASGHRVTAIGSRLERPDLPVIAGEGAETVVPEAMRLIEAAAPVAPRMRGLVRMGGRRWDLVLDRGQRILLPEIGAVDALQRVMALAEADEMLERDVTVVDMRNGARPTLRLTPQALGSLRGQELETGATNG